MKFNPQPKSKRKIPVCPTISLNSPNTLTNYENNNFSIKKKILSINTNNNNSSNGNIHVYTRKINFHFLNNTQINETPILKQKLIFTQSLGDLRKINNLSSQRILSQKGNITSSSIPRFKKTTPKFLRTEPFLFKKERKIFVSKEKSPNNSQTNTQININKHNMNSTPHDKQLFENKLNNMKKSIKNYKLSKTNIAFTNPNITIIEQPLPYMKKNNSIHKDNKNNYNKKLITDISNNQRRDTKRLLPFVKSNTSSSSSILNFFTEKSIQDFICKAIQNPNNDECTSIPSSTFSINQNILGLNNFSFFGIYKSIGKDGYHLSCIAKTKFEKIFSSLSTYFNINPSQHNIHYNESDIYIVIKNNNFNLIKNAFDKVNTDIYNSRYDKDESGFSVFLLFSIGSNIITASVGSFVRGLSIMYRNDNGKEIVLGRRLDGYYMNSNSEMCFGVGNENVNPFIMDMNINVINVKSIFIANSALFDIIGQKSICRVVTKSILLGDKKKVFFQQEKISDVGKRIVTLYKELCIKSGCLQEEIVFVLIYL